ncbi:MAG: hypothetical protein B7Z37_09830 [Verrucomicrobia bacterium 12-59-8]|nr:MAG: hypothetical protein B7Z37_09830 [Verrucomicrobia bacterium 12-59-8]
MTPPSTILASERDRSSALAWGTLCVLAVVQMSLALKLLTVTRDPAAGIRPVTTAPSPTAPAPSMVPEIGQIAQPTRVIAPPLPGSLMPAPAPAVPVYNGPPPIGSFSQSGAATPAPSFIAQAPPATAAPFVPAPAPGMPAAPQTAAFPSATATPGPAPTRTIPPEFATKPDPATALLRDVNYVITSAKEIRGMSDMQQALELLRKADELNPDHPAIIAEMAQTYEQMGLTAKATDAWRRIQLLGTTKAGSYFELATRRLGSGSAAVTAPALSAGSGAESEKFLRLGACQVARDFTINAGERYVLRVPIVRAGNRTINGQELNLEVFFFDRVNHEKVALTIAPEPVETWQSAPVDWAGTGEELLDVVYHLPALSAAEIQQHGRRTYYGYMLRLYYNNKLQDVAAEPRDLLEFGSAPGSVPAGVNPLLPPMGK